MKIGTSRILVCPFCGEEKEIMSLAMGNSLGAQLWSDNKLIARMLPTAFVYYTINFNARTDYSGISFTY